MPTTPKYALPYPAPTAAADVPTDMAALANAIDALPQLGYFDGSGNLVIPGDLTAQGGDLYIQDQRLSRLDANTLKTFAAFVAVNSIVATQGNTTNQIQLGSDGKLSFGTAYDTAIYRSAAHTLRTDTDWEARVLFCKKRQTNFPCPTGFGTPADSSPINVGMGLPDTARIQLPKTGFYLVWHLSNWPAGAAGSSRESFIQGEGSINARWCDVAITPVAGGAGVTPTGMTIVQATAGDNIYLTCYQDSGASITLPRVEWGAAYLGHG